MFICKNLYKLVDQFTINYCLAVAKQNCILNGVFLGGGGVILS